MILINDIVLGNSQYYAANFIRYFLYQDTPYACFNAIKNTNHMSVVPISTITFNPLGHNIQLRMPMMLEVRQSQSISMIKGNNFQLDNNVSIFYSSAKILTPVNSAVLVGLFNGTGFNVDSPFRGKVEFVIQDSSFNHKNKEIKAIQNLNLVEEPVESNVIQNGDLNNKSLEFEAEDSKLAFDEEQQAISVFFDKVLPQLMKFQKFYREYSKSIIKTPTEKRLIDNYREFITKHSDINLGRSDVANFKTICAHGTNAWTVFSAFAFTNLQLLPKFAMKVRGVPIGAGELISEKEKAKFNKWVSYPNTISQNYVSTVWLGSKDSALAEVFDYADKSTELYKRGYDKFKEKLLKKCKDQSVVQELKEILKSDLMSKTYEALSSIPVVIIGDGIGGVGVDSSISGETGYERVNIRIVVIPKVLQIFIQKLIEKINPKKFKDVALLTIEELVAFEDNRPKKRKPTCFIEVGGPRGRLIPMGVHKNTFIHDFLSTFGDKLPFSISDKFDRVPIERTTLEKKEIKGQLIASTSKAGYYKANPDINVTYDEEDSSYLNTEVANNLCLINKQESDKKEDTQQPEIQSSITEDFDSTEDLNAKSISHIEPSITDVSSSTIDDDSKIVDSKIVSSNQQQKTSTTKKAMYATMIASPFIAVGVYTAVALSAGIVSFNHIIAAGIFVDVATLAVMYFLIAKVCKKVNEEKGKDKNISTCTALKNVFTPECFKSSEAAIS